MALLAGLSSCEKVHEFTPAEVDDQFLSIYAMFYDDDRDENNFPAEVDQINHVITFVFPYNYPQSSENILTMADLEKVRVKANLPTGYVVEPAFGQFNFNETHSVDVIDQKGNRTTYSIVCEIRKSAECMIEEFALLNPDGTTGIIKENNKTVTLLTQGTLGKTYAKYVLSHGATITPDPETTLVDYDTEPEFTVTAQNGVDKSVYKMIKGTPTMMPFGVRTNSAKLMWTKKLVDLGIAPSQGKDGATGLAVMGDYLVINNGQKNEAILVNYKNGTEAGTLDLSAVGTDDEGKGNNYRITSDCHNNLFICCNSQTNGNKITVWQKAGLNGTIKKVLNASTDKQMGNQMSVTGNFDENMIMTISANGSAIDFYRWSATNGYFNSRTATSVHANGYAGTCWGTADVTYIDPAKPDGRFIIAAYCGFATTPPAASGSNNRTVAMFDGDGNILNYGSKMISSNWVENAGDVLRFNGVDYYIHNSVNTFTWGSDDCLYMYDLGGGNLSSPIFDFTDQGLNINRSYGGTAAGSQGRGGNANDVMLYPSPDGFYMYIFFMFTNGSVGCVRTDCIDMTV